MKKEISSQRTNNNDEINQNIDKLILNRQKVKETNERESASSQIKIDSETVNSLPLSFEIPNKEYPQLIKDNPVIHQVPLVSNQTMNSNNMLGFNMTGLERSSSPFVVDVHRLSFNNFDFNFPPGRSLFLNSNK